MINRIVKEIRERLTPLLASWALSKKVVLYIEDSEPDIETVAAQLQEHGITLVGGFGSSLEKLIKKHVVGAVVVDHALPDEKSGFAVLNRYRQDIGLDVPRIGYSYWLKDMAECRRIAAMYGEDVRRYVRKPAKNGNLVEAICSEVIDPVWAGFEQALRTALETSLLGTSEVLSSACGEVVRIGRDRSVVTLSTAGGELTIEFPTWRLVRAKSDDVGRRVEHVVSRNGTRVVSDLGGLDAGGPDDVSLAHLETMDESILEELRQLEEEEEDDIGES